MNTTTKLPKGFDDEKSLFFVPKDLRDDYPRDVQLIEKITTEEYAKYDTADVIYRHQLGKVSADTNPRPGYDEVEYLVLRRAARMGGDRRHSSHPVEAEQAWERFRSEMNAVLGGAETTVAAIIHLRLLGISSGTITQRGQREAEALRVRKYLTCEICGIANPKNDAPTGRVTGRSLVSPQQASSYSGERGTICGACFDAAARQLADHLDAQPTKNGKPRAVAVREALLARGLL